MGSSTEDSRNQSAENDIRDGRPDEYSRLPASKRIKLAKALFNKGMQYRRTGDSGRALIEFLKATREDSKCLDAYYEQAMIFREKGFHKLAASRLEQLLAIKPRYQKARILLAAIRLEQGKLGDAMEQLGESLGMPKRPQQNLVSTPSPKDGPSTDDGLSGVPAMLLQSLHTALLLPAVPQQSKSQSAATATASGAMFSQAGTENEPAELSEQDSPAERQSLKKRKGKSNRHQIREMLAKRYRKFDKGKNNSRFRKHWMARIFSWPEPFMGSLASNPVSDNERNLQSSQASTSSPPILPDRVERTTTAKKSARSPFWSEFEKEKEPPAKLAVNDMTSTWGEWSDYPSTESSNTANTPDRTRIRGATGTAKNARTGDKALLTYRGDPFDTIAVLKNNETRNDERQPSPRCSTVASDASSSKNWLVATNPVAKSEPAENARTENAAVPEKKPVKRVQILNDEWTKKLQYLNEHGTSTLNAGEAFMFSEDTGEAVLFLSDGRRISRMIAEPVDNQELIKQRRPDVLIPKELLYNTSLLGKLVKQLVPSSQSPVSAQGISSSQEAPPSAVAAPHSTGGYQQLESETSPQSPSPPFKIEQMMENSSGFLNWLKSLVNL